MTLYTDFLFLTLNQMNGDESYIYFMRSTDNSVPGHFSCSSVALPVQNNTALKSKKMKLDEYQANFRNLPDPECIKI